LCAGSLIEIEYTLIYPKSQPYILVSPAAMEVYTTDSLRQLRD